MKYEINKELVASSSHITRNDALLLSDPDSAPSSCLLIWDRIEYGYLIWTNLLNYIAQPEWEANLLDSGFSIDLVNLMNIAKSEGCKWLRVDCDGLVYPHLPEHTW